MSFHRERAAELKLEEGEVFVPPMISALRDEDNPSAMNTSFVRQRINQEPRIGRPSNQQITGDEPEISQYAARTNELMGRTGSTEQLEAILNDRPTKDIYGRDLIAPTGDGWKKPPTVLGDSDFDDLEALLASTDSPPRQQSQQVALKQSNTLDQSPSATTIKKPIVQLTPQRNWSEEKISGLPLSTSIQTFGPSTQTFGPGSGTLPASKINSESNAGFNNDDFTESGAPATLRFGPQNSVGTEANESGVSGVSQHGSGSKPKGRASRIRMPGALAGDEYAHGTAGLSSPLYSSTAPSGAMFSKSQEGSLLPPDTLGASLAGARDDMYNPNFLSSSSARASMQDHHFLSVPSQQTPSLQNEGIGTSPYPSQPTQVEPDRRTMLGDENMNPIEDNANQYGKSRHSKLPRYNYSEDTVESNPERDFSLSGGSNGIATLEDRSNSMSNGGIKGTVKSHANIGGLRDSQDALGLLGGGGSVSGGGGGGGMGIGKNFGSSAVGSTKPSGGGYGSMFGFGGSRGSGQPAKEVQPPKPSKSSRFGRLASFGMAGMFGKSSSNT